MSCLPNLYVPGFPKSATTSISHALAQHSSIYSPVSVEPHYWASDLPFYAAREGIKNESSYKALYKRASVDHQWRLDGSTLYLYSETAAASIVKAVPNARFIVCLRAPEDIVLAWHMQMLNGNYESEQNPEKAFKLSTQRRQKLSVPTRCPDAQLLDYEKIASVGTQFSRLINTVGEENVHVITMASVISDSQSVLEGCWRFLNIRYEPHIALSKTNSAFAVRHPWLRRSIYHPSVKPYVTKLINKLPAQAGEDMRNVFRKILYQKTERKAASEEFRITLRELFREERRVLRDSLAKLSDGPDLSDPQHKDFLD